MILPTGNANDSVPSPKRNDRPIAIAAWRRRLLRDWRESPEGRETRQARYKRLLAEQEAIARANTGPVVTYGPDNIPANLLKAYPELATQQPPAALEPPKPATILPQKSRHKG